MLKVERLLSAAQERLVTIKTDALLIDAARLLNGPRLNLVVICDESGKMAGALQRRTLSAASAIAQVVAARWRPRT